MLKKQGIHEDIDHILVSEEQLLEKLNELGRIITEEYRGKNPIFVCVMKGSIHFFSDLVRRFDDYCEIDFLSSSAYGDGTVNSGVVRINKDLDMSITGRHVVIVEDIMDSGVTLNYLTGILNSRNPASLKVVTLLDKPERRRCAINPDYCGFIVPDEFVVGYGLDYAQVYRNLPYVGVLKPEAINTDK